MNPSRNKSVCLTLAFFLVPCLSAAFNNRDPFDIDADMIEYIDHAQVLIAEGRVKVTQGSSTLTADRLQYDRLGRRLVARGNVIVREKGTILIGDQMDYDLAQEKGIVLGGKGVSSPWYFQGGSWEKEKDYYGGRHASFTNCELIDPHYHFRSSRVHVIPDRHFWAWNNRIYIHKTPVFYSPFVYKAMGERRLVLQVQPGNDSVKGAFAKTITTARFTPHMYDRLYVDFYSNSGTGYGNEFNYEKPDRYKGSIFGYYIKPKGSPELAGAPKAAQYNMRLYHWQRLGHALTLQSNTNHRRNVSFNNQFFPQDYNQSVNDVSNSVALTHQKGRITQRIVTEAFEGPDPGANPLFGDTHIQTASLPRYEMTLYQTPLWSPKQPSRVTGSTTAVPAPEPGVVGPLLLTMNAGAGNSYSRLDERMRANANGSFTLSETLALSRRFSLSPTVTPAIIWRDKRDPGGTGFRGYQNRLGTATTFRARLLSALTLDQTYSWTARMEPNRLSLDRGASDGGVETHHLGWLLFWRPSRSTMLRSFSGYDLRRFENESLAAYRQRRVDPWTVELTWQPPLSVWELYLNHRLGYAPFLSQLWEASFRTRLPYNTILETGFLYNRNQRDFLTWNNRFGFYLSPGWRIDATLNMLVPNNSLKTLKYGDILQSEFALSRDLHCWTFRFLYRDRPPFTREYSVFINLKLGAERAKAIADKDLEGQFYPWRATRP